MAIRILPTPPRRTDDPDTFIANTDAWMTTLPGWTDDVNALAAGLDSIAAGGAYAIPTTWGALQQFGGTSQSTMTALLSGFVDSRGQSITAQLNSFNASSSSVKGQIRLIKQGDATKYLVMNVISSTPSSSYQTINVAVIDSSSANPFVNGDAVLLFFQRTGDVGPAGTLTRRVVSVTADSAPSPNVSVTDTYEITAQTVNCTLGVPTGTPTNGQTLMFRIRDNGTSRTIAYNTVYRAPVELPFPSATVAGKWTYLGFVYNATDGKWDLVAAISNM